MAVWLALAAGAGATELLVNRSFDQNGANWVVATPGTNAGFFATTGEASLHGNGYVGTLMWQYLDVPNAGGASGTASIAMNKLDAPPGNTIAVYLDYTVASGSTNRLLLLNPSNADVPAKPNSSVFSTNFTLPAEAQRLVRLAVDKTYFGMFYAQEFSLDVTTGGAPELGLSIVAPTDGATNPAPLLLRAEVTNLTATVTRVEFCTNGIPLGQGSLDPHGEWMFADGTHFSVMGGGGYEMVDYSPPVPADMFFMNGGYTSLTNFTGMFQYFGTGGMGGGLVDIVYSLSAAGQLTAAITGDAPLGVRTLINGTCLSDTIRYGFFWANAPAGSYAVTARAVWGSGLSVTSAPVNLTVPGPVEGPRVQIRQISPTQIELSWPDDGNTYEVLTQASLGAGSWDPVVGNTTLSSGGYERTVLSATNRSGFFRLHKL